MKKIISFLLAGAALLGFVGCSGDLHDVELPKHEPVVIPGASWYYTDIAIWGDSDGTAEGFIVNGSSQSTNTKLPEFNAETGGVVYYTVNKDIPSISNPGQYEMLTSYQSDNPAATPEPGKLRVYVYTNETNPNLHYWGGKFKATTWPGLAMTKNGETAKQTYNASATLKSITVMGLPTTLNGQELYLTGAPIGWSKPGTGASVKVTVSGGMISATGLDIALSASDVEVGKVGVTEMKFAAANWTKPEVTAADGQNFKIKIINGEEVNLYGMFTATKGPTGDDANVYCCTFAQ